MKIKHYCPNCKREKEIEGMKNNMRVLWRRHFDEDYDFFKTKQQIKRRDDWIKEKIEIVQKMSELMQHSQFLEEKFMGNKDFIELRRINSELAFLKQRFDYREKESDF